MTTNTARSRFAGTRFSWWVGAGAVNDERQARARRATAQPGTRFLCAVPPVRAVMAGSACHAGGFFERIAADLDMAPGNLSVALADEGVRHLSLDAFERYLQTTGDLTPLYYLVERYLGDQGAARAEALDRVMRMAEQLEALPALLAAAGVAKGKRR